MRAPSAGHGCRVAASRSALAARRSEATVGRLADAVEAEGGLLAGGGGAGGGRPIGDVVAMKPGRDASAHVLVEAVMRRETTGCLPRACTEACRDGEAEVEAVGLLDMEAGVLSLAADDAYIGAAVVAAELCG